MSRLNEAVAVIDDAVLDATRGLPTEVFYLVSRLTPLVNVDLLIGNEAGDTLLTWREDQYYGPCWHIPGSIIRFRETWSERIQAAARDELGVAVSHDPAPTAIHQMFAPPPRVNRGHFISMLFVCRLEGALNEETRYRGDGAPRHGQWAWHARPPDNLIKVHTPFRRFIGCGDGALG